MTILGLQYDADAAKAVPVTSFFPANGIVSSRKFISSPLHIHLKSFVKQSQFDLYIA